MATLGRRSAVVAASSGLIVSILAAPASAAPDNSAASQGSADSSGLTQQARAQLNTAPVVKVANASFGLSAKPVKVKPAPVVVPPPAPEPAAAPAPAPAPAASRSGERAAAPAAAPAATPAPAAVAAAPAQVQGAGQIVSIASRYVGTPYVWAGRSPAGFDCSGFVGYVYAQVGITLPRTSGAIRAAGTVVSAANARPGDLAWSPGHISIYAGNGQQIDSVQPGDSVRFRSMNANRVTFLRFT